MEHPLVPHFGPRTAQTSRVETQVIGTPELGGTRPSGSGGATGSDCRGCGRCCHGSREVALLCVLVMALRGGKSFDDEQGA